MSLPLTADTSHSQGETDDMPRDTPRDTPRAAAPSWQRAATLAGLPSLDLPDLPDLPDPPHEPRRAPLALESARPVARLDARFTAPLSAAAPGQGPGAHAPTIDRARAARLDRRALAIVVVCVALLLLGAVAPFAWASRAGTAGQPRAVTSAPTSQSQASTAAPTAPAVPTRAPTPPATATQVSTATPAATPRPSPTRTPPPAPTQTPVPAPSGPLTAPTQLVLSCAAPTGLTIHNTGGATIAWNVTPPSSVRVNGWAGEVSGTLAPRGTLVLAISVRSGSVTGTTHLILVSQAERLPVTLTIPAC